MGSCFSYIKIQNKPISSFEQQTLYIKTCVQAVDSYAKVMGQDTLNFFVRTQGFPGIGKTLAMLFIGLYAVSKGLLVMITKKMAKRSK